MKLIRSFFTSLHNTVFILDKDGTLVDTESMYFEAFNRLLAPHGCKHDLSTHADMMGAQADTCLEILRRTHPNFPQDASMHDALRESLAKHIGDVRRERGTPTMPGAPTFLGCSKNLGVRLAMATSATRENTEIDLRALGWRRRFDAIVTADDVSRHKPAPDVYLEAAKRLGADPANCIAFEDGLRGVQSAHAAGMRVVFVRDERFGITPPAEAALTVNNLNELLV